MAQLAVNLYLCYNVSAIPVTQEVLILSEKDSSNSKKSSGKFRYIAAAFILIVSLFVGVFLGSAMWLIEDTPDISEYRGGVQTSKILSSDGELLNSLFVEDRVYVELEEIPEELQQAMISIEDHNFYDHHGIDMVGITRAMLTNIMEGRTVQGGSTITQQLARSALLTQEQTVYRKLQEIYLAMQFERMYTKSQILEMYLNEIFLGHNAYGVQAASRHYFDKDVSELNLEESALLAALPRAPNFYSPYNNKDGARQRRNVVLNRMNELGYIDQEEAERAKEASIEVERGQEEDELDDKAPYFVRYVRDRLLNMFGVEMVYGGGLEVKTTLDLEQQKAAEDALETSVENYIIPTVERDYTHSPVQPQYSLISLDPQTGGIQALIGGRGEEDYFNRATQAARQPGSAFKPLVYAAAINEGHSPGDTVYDIPRSSPKPDSTYQIWPVNYEHEYHGLVSLRHALTHSLNVAAVNMIEEVGVRTTTDLAEELGITTFTEEDYFDDHLSLALGGLNRGVTPLELTSAYSAFAAEGVWSEPHAIKEVRDREGNVIYEANPSKKAVLPEEDSYLVLDMMRSVVEEGTGWRAEMEREVAGKTGTTNKFTDAWFIGMIPESITGVWIGEDQPRRMNYDTTGRIGSAHATMVWSNYMDEIVEEIPETSFEKPDNIVTQEIDPINSLLPGSDNPRAVQEIFREDNIPDEISPYSQPIDQVRLDEETGLLATTTCPQERITTASYFQESGILLGPFSKSFQQRNPPGDYEPISGVYKAQENMPVLDIDPETGMPVETEDNEPAYAMVPEEPCPDHTGFVLDEPQIGDPDLARDFSPDEAGETPDDVDEGLLSELGIMDDDAGADEEATPEDLSEDDIEEAAEEDDAEEEIDEDRMERIDSLIDMLSPEEE